jgi:hypothetical protein
MYGIVKQLTYRILIRAMKTNGEATCIVECLPLSKCLSNDLVFLQSNWLFCLAVQSPKRERNTIIRSFIKAILLVVLHIL